MYIIGQQLTGLYPAVHKLQDRVLRYAGGQGILYMLRKAEGERAIQDKGLRRHSQLYGKLISVTLFIILGIQQGKTGPGYFRIGNGAIHAWIQPVLRPAQNVIPELRGA